LPIYEDQLTGAVYVFSKSNGTWSQQRKLTVDINKQGIFGSSVALSGDGNTVLAGAAYENTENGDQAGAAYVFGNDGGSSGSNQVSINNVKLDSATINSPDIHTLSFTVSGLSPDDARDDIRIALPEKVTVESVREATSPDTSYGVTIQQETNPIKLYVDPSGPDNPVEMDVKVKLKLSAKNS
jgi:hypothetical protein